ncbi:hypothetical protein J4G07_06195 [Candidatus Poribacteria bacterium]|nr:hypothetical protein [Candidatus Poribacteria bacterium]
MKIDVFPSICYYIFMPKFNLKPNHKAIRDYYTTLQHYKQHTITHEGAVSSPFDTLLQACAQQVNATLVPQYSMHTVAGNRIVIDGVILDEYGLPFAYWEAKDIEDNLITPESENQVICVSPPGTKLSFHALMIDVIPDLHITGDSQCFPFYTYDEDGTNRQENITDWALAEFRTHYGDDTLTKWDIFHYNYGLLHHPAYREKYEMNLKRDLPHIPFAEDFWGFATAGEALADIHVNYESVPKYDELKYIETPGMRVDWRVEKMKLSKDKTQLQYNDFLTLDAIPAEVHDYRLGTRSALEWVVDQYRVKTDKRTGIVNDPNRETEPRYIVDLIGRVIDVSLRTVEIVGNLPEL